jgi:hypothetical protein
MQMAFTTKVKDMTKSWTAIPPVLGNVSLPKDGAAPSEQRFMALIAELEQQLRGRSMIRLAGGISLVSLLAACGGGGGGGGVAVAVAAS